MMPRSQAGRFNLLFKSLSNNPHVGLLGMLLGVEGIVISIYFYYDVQKYPFLKMYEIPRKTVVVSKQDASNIEIYSDGKPVEEDVSATQLVVWNAGESPIYEGMILRKIEIFPINPLKIYDVQVTKITRDVTDFKLSSSQLKKNVIPISWRILEPDDGAIVQIIHSGRFKENQELFDIRGTIETQGDVSKYEVIISKSKLRKVLHLPERNDSYEQKTDKFLSITTILTGFSVIVLSIYRMVTNKNSYRYLVFSAFGFFIFSLA